MTPDDVAVAALAGLSRMTPRRLRVLLHHHAPADAWDVVAGRAEAAPLVRRLLDHDGVGRTWQPLAVDDALTRARRRCLEASIVVLRRDRPGYPAPLVHDPAAPAALFVRGDLARLADRRVAIVGTRNATRGGREFAARLGAELSDAGVSVVSGLARGIDGAAHRGALDVSGAAPLAVIGNGPDRAYPRQHRGLFADVAERGAVVSEWPPAVTPDGYRFPLRNRLIAGFSEVVVVVESRATGGSMSTVREALARDVTVMAVPGSPGAPASVGPNALLADGAAPITSIDDVLVALGLDGRRSGAARFDGRPPPLGLEARVLERCRGAPATLDDVARACGGDVRAAALALARLERDGWVAEAGGWFEAIGAWGDLA